jgi:hypothetical protein
MSNVVRIASDRRRDKGPKAPPDTVNRGAIQSLENKICELATAAELAVDLFTDGNSAKTSFVLDQVERLAKELHKDYYSVVQARQ